MVQVRYWKGIEMLLVGCYRMLLVGKSLPFFTFLLLSVVCFVVCLFVCCFVLLLVRYIPTPVVWCRDDITLPLLELGEICISRLGLRPISGELLCFPRLSWLSSLTVLQ